MLRIVHILICIASIHCVGNRQTLPAKSPCPEALEEGARAVLIQNGVANASTYFPQGVAQTQQQMYKTEICPLTALSMAIRAFLHREEPESFVSISNEIGKLGCGARCFLNRSTSLLGLVTGSTNPNRLFPLPSQKDDLLRTHWVFYLTVSDLSEHGYWAIVTRDGTSVRLMSEN